jgi:hypothetical protein
LESNIIPELPRPAKADRNLVGRPWPMRVHWPVWRFHARALYKRGNELKAAHAKIEELGQTDELNRMLNRRDELQANPVANWRATRPHRHRQLAAC